ncbi:MAG: DUF1501 domain-containing protein [Planctomycetota bacterium]|nr:DUF1501 domain-containing protein [Planctomycetota bacterium]
MCDHQNLVTNAACGTSAHWNRRTLLAAGGLCWLTPLVTRLAADPGKTRKRSSAQSVILLWMNGAPSQLETFDPHPGTRIAAGSRARKTSVSGIQLGEGLEQVADLMDQISLVRSVTSKEGDHERALYNVKTGFRPDPTLVHPAIGSVVCHQLKSGARGEIDIPRHVSIFPGSQPGRGGYLGDQYDAFKIFDPVRPLPDLRKRVSDGRFDQRLDTLRFLEQQDPFRRKNDPRSAYGDPNTAAALKMMSSRQLQAFDISRVPLQLREEFGETPFGRGCLAAMQLVEAGVRCVEVTLSGWDSHIDNHKLQAGQIEILDPAFAALLRNLKKRELLDQTVVLCGGEFGRTPGMNLADGRDHWPHGFSVALAGGGIRGGRVVGETSPDPKLNPKKPMQDLRNPKTVEDIHATVLDRLGIDFEQELDTPVGRPMVVSKGSVIRELVES